MRFVKPEVFLIAKSVPEKSEIYKWLDSIGCDDRTATHYADGGTVAECVKTNGERITELAGRRCYLSFQVGLNPNVKRIREDIAEYCENILRVGHGSVLEHTTFTFAIENVSRVCTGELNRHRAGAAISEGSMRFIKFNDIPIVETPLLTLTEEDRQDFEYKKYIDAGFDGDITSLQSTAVKKARTRQVIESIVTQIEFAYAELCAIWWDELKPSSVFAIKKHITSMIRRIVPMGVATGGVWTYNIRALRHLCTMRCSEAAEEEIAVLGGKILEIMMREEPILLGDFHPNENGYWVPQFLKV